MKRILAYRVSKAYDQWGWSGLYGIEYQSSGDYNWHRVASYYRDMKQAEIIANSIAKIYGVHAYDLGGYEIK